MVESTWLVYMLTVQSFENFHQKIMEKTVNPVSILLDLSEPLINILHTSIRAYYVYHLHNFLVSISCSRTGDGSDFFEDRNGSLHILGNTT